MTVDKKYFKSARIDVMPGYSVIPESPTYPVRDDQVSGSITLHGQSDGDSVTVRLVVISQYDSRYDQLLGTTEFFCLVLDALCKDLLEPSEVTLDFKP